MKKEIKCPKCGTIVEVFKNPKLTVDIIIRYQGKIILIKRGEPPYGLALPGGYVDYGESLETAAEREALEETGLKLRNLQQFQAYSDPKRDARQHNVSVIFQADGEGEPTAGSDAREIVLFNLKDLEIAEFAFDHQQVLKDYLAKQIYRS
jgi:8-oxo-dGTP diphosphatase